MFYEFTYYEDPKPEEFPTIIAHYNVICPHCCCMHDKKYAFMYGSGSSDTLEEAKQHARDFKGNWHYIDVELPKQKAEELAKQKLRNI